MDEMLNREESGWDLARCWLAALEETARDFHGTLPKAFCERGYEHATQRWFRLLEEKYGITVPKAKTVKEAVENHIEAGVRTGLFRDASQFELTQVNPQRLELKVFDCPYRPTCENLLESGFTIRDLTCARIGCFKASAEILTGTPCKYEVTGFRPDGCCEGYIEHR
jgi:hypothetical protein